MARILLMSLLLVIFLISGYAIAEHELFPYRHIKKIESATIQMVRGRGSKDGKSNSSRSISTFFIRLDLTSVDVPVDRKGPGSGLTSFGDELVLLSGRGEIFVIHGHTVLRTRIYPPDDGFEEYERASVLEKYKGYNLDIGPFWPRNNDLLYYSDDGKNGLVVSYTEYFADRECYGSTIAHLDVPESTTSLLDVDAPPDAREIIYRSFAPGTLMPDSGIEDPDVIHELVEIMRKIKQEDE